MLRLVAAAMLLVTAHVQSSPTGAPTAACDNMVPQHSTDPQDSQSPYVLSAAAQPCPSGGECFEVSISGGTFRGFFMQARYIGDEPPSNDQSPVGTWEIADASTVKHRGCGGNQENGVTHVDNTDKDAISAFFNPGGADLAGLQIVASVVQQRDTFWVGQRIPLA